jgi:dolichyl-phosphate-mannose--protein O-mannosyl transferase
VTWGPPTDALPAADSSPAYERGPAAATGPPDEQRSADERGPAHERGRPRVAVPEAIRRRLEPPLRRRDWVSWGATLWVVLIAAVLRFWDLGFPPDKIFDEVYYANEGAELLDHGVEWRTDVDSEGKVTNSYGDYVVHPPLGKWMIALGIRMNQVLHLGNDAFGWRLMAAVVGVLSVLILTRTARRLFRSTVLGCAAGLLMALDGMHFVLSRTAILDIFLMFFIVAAFACLVLDRDARRRRWLREMENGLDPTLPGRAGRPGLTWATVPWWRLAAGVMLGCAGAVKWSAVFFVPVFLALIVFWEVSARRSAGVRHPWRDTLLDESGWIAIFVGLMLVTYLASWTGWFLTDTGWKRHYLESRGGNEWPILGPLYNLYQYHVEMYGFHSQLDAPHQYQSWPWQWLILGRPVAFYWSSNPGCGASTCAAEVLLLGTPVLWWSFLPALAGLVWFGISRRDSRAWAIGLGVFAGIVPWFAYQLDDRVMFYFYALPAEPFLILAVVYVLGSLISGPGVGRYGSGRVRIPLSLPAEDRRLYGTIFAGAYVLFVALCFWWFYPLYVGESIPYDDWLRHMLLGNRWV